MWVPNKGLIAFQSDALNGSGSTYRDGVESALHYNNNMMAIKTTRLTVDD